MRASILLAVAVAMTAVACNSRKEQARDGTEMRNSRGEPVGRVPGTFIDTTATGESVEPSPSRNDQSLGAPRPTTPTDSAGNPRSPGSDTTRPATPRR